MFSFWQCLFESWFHWRKKLNWQFSGDSSGVTVSMRTPQLAWLQNIWMMYLTAVCHKMQCKDSPLNPDISEIMMQISRNTETSVGYIYRTTFLRNFFLWRGWVQGFFSSQLGHFFAFTWDYAYILPWKKNYDQPRQHIKKQRHYFANKGPSSQSYGFFQWSCMDVRVGL